MSSGYPGPPGRRPDRDDWDGRYDPEWSEEETRTRRNDDWAEPPAGNGNRDGWSHDPEPGRGNLSDLWQEPDPWAADARRDEGQHRNSGDWPERPAGRHGRGPARDDYRQDQRGYREPDRYPNQRGYRDPAGYQDADSYRDQSGYQGAGYQNEAGPYPGDRYRDQRYPDEGYPDQRQLDQRQPDRPGRPDDYQSPVTWSGPSEPPRLTRSPEPPPAAPPRRNEPDGPTVAHRDPGGWHEAPPPHFEPAGNGPASSEPPGGERAWWDDAFRPPAPGQQIPQATQAPALPAQQAQAALPAPERTSPAEPGPGGRPPRPERHRRFDTEGYGVPPGELTQPIPIYQPQGSFIADPYRLDDTFVDYARPVFIPKRPDEPDRPIRRGPVPDQREAPAGGLTRSTRSMAIGTLISRVTGFLRTFVFAAALGEAALGNAYNLANTLPNAVYDVMIGGVLTSVVVPLLVKATKEHRDGGEAYNQRMFTLSVLALGAVTIVATAAAGLLVDLYAGSVHGPEHRLTVVFAYFFIPQIFFYGMSSLMGAILNARNSFAAPMWTPIINNVIVIVVGLLFVVMIGLHKTAADVSSGGILLLGVGTTLGIIVQTVALFPAMRQVRFHWRPRFDFRREELGEIGRMAIWMLGYVVSTQVTFIVTTRLANEASQHVADAGVTAYNYSYALFLLPYAIIGVSVTTALLPRMSRHASEGRFELVREDFSYSIRLSSVILVPAALLLAVLGPALCELLFSYGSSTVQSARYIGEAFGAFSLGLIPFVIFQLLLRVFYALHDSRTPAIIGFWTMAATVVGNFIALAILPPGELVIGMAFVYGVTSVLSAAIAWRKLNNRVGSLDGRLVTRSLVRMHVATVPALIFAFVVSIVLGGFLHPGAVYGFITVLLGGGGALLLYVIVAKALHLDELSQLTRMVLGRFGGRAG